MKFTTTRSIDKNILSVTVAFKEYGTNDLTAEEEKEIFESYPTKLVYSDITFSGKYQVTGKEVVANPGGDQIELTLNNKSVKVDGAFTVSYRIDANTIPASALTGKNHLNKAELLAQGYCKLFEDKVKDRLKTILSATRDKYNNFESSEEFTI